MSGWRKDLLWFAGLYLGSIAALSVVSISIRSVLQFAAQ
ncbi:hypothetical protein V1280_000548 [Bradyrhizobium sp. AZCC 2230]